MKLTRKFIAALVGGVAIVAMFQAFFDYRRERDVFDSQMRAEASALGRALARGMAEVWARDGEAAAREFLNTTSNQNERIRARWFWLDSQRDAPRASGETLAAMKENFVVVTKDEPSNLLLTYIRVEAPERRDLAERQEPMEVRLGGIEVAQSLSELDKYTADSLRNQVIGFLSEVIVAAALALLLGVVFIGRPVAKLADKARRVGTGDLSGPLHLKQRDELAELANEINEMCDRLSEERGARELATEQLRHADRLTTVGKLASGLAHELGTPLNVVSGRARLIRDGEVEGSEAIDSARIVAEQADRMTALIRQLLDFARPRALRKAPVNLISLVARVGELVATLARKAQVSIRTPQVDAFARSRATADSSALASVGDDARVDADEGQLHQVLTNLVVNAIQATPANGTVSIAVKPAVATPPQYVERRDHDWLTLEVTDSGIGMDEATRSRIFEPFFTTKPVGDGTGLGLSVTWGIVREHGGWIEVVSTPSQGSTFTVYLPVGGTA